MKMSKTTKLCCSVVVIAATVLFLTRNALFAPNEVEHAASFEIPITNNYSFLEFRNVSDFQAKVRGKHVGSFLNKKTGQTNYYATVILEKNDGEWLTVSDNYNSSQDILMLFTALEKDRLYTFPDALRLATYNPTDFIH